MSALWQFVLLALLLVGANPLVALGDDVAEVAHRQGRLTVDGNGADWGGVAGLVELRRPAVAGEPAARATVRLAWDRVAMWALLEVEDPTLHGAPAAASGAALFQWDSVELYLDGRGDRTALMGTDDFQVILAPDGRYAVLQGDALLAELEDLSVPKRERPSVALDVVGRRTPGGYLVECMIPFAALGITAAEGKVLALDIGLNDWLADHAPVDQLHFDLQSLLKLDQQPGGAAPAYTLNGLEVEPAADLEARLYRPWSLASGDDFGHPRGWRPVRLTGRPALADRVVELLGPGWTLAAGALSALLLAAGIMGVSEHRHRRRIGELLERIAAIEPARQSTARPDSHPRSTSDASPTAAEAPTPRPPVALELLEHVIESTPVSEPEALELRALRAIHDRVGAPLTPAELASALFVSLRTLERRLTVALACTPGELILVVRMREARRLLEQRELQVQEVARRVGYDDPAHFSRRFKAYFGLSPAAWRQAAEHSARARRSAA